MKRRLLKLTFLLFATSFLACSQPSGTETGNPFIEQYIASIQIMNGVCTTLVRCHGGVTEKACKTAFRASTESDSALGLAATTYANFQEVIDAETAQQITATLQPSLDCESELEQLACGNAGVQAAYNSAAGDPYDQIESIFSGSTPSCALVF